MPITFRIGRKEKRVDNIHAGGLVIGVEDDGHLLAYAYELGYGKGTKKYTAHPDNCVVFEGSVLPKIPDIISAAGRVHGKMPHIGMVTWDFAVNEKCQTVLV